MKAKIGFAGKESRETRWTNPLSPTLRKEMIDLWASGVHSEIVAEQFGVHPAYVRKAAARAGVKSCMPSGHRP